MIRLLTLLVLVAMAATVPGAALADGPRAPAQTAKKKKKKGITATVNATLSLRADDPLGFGGDKGPRWQQLKITVKNAEIPLYEPSRDSGAAKAQVSIEYKAEASTQDRSWHAGCDSENVSSSGTWSGKASISVKTSKWLQTGGKSKAFSGWTVSVSPPDDFPWTTKRTWVDWESILMEKCLSFESKDPLAGWGPGFARVEGVGKMTSSNRSVLLSGVNADTDQTGTASGSVKFSAVPTPPKTKFAPLN